MKRAGPIVRKWELARRAKLRRFRKANGIGKYGVAVKRQRTRLGVLYDSKLEMRYAEQLDLLRHALRPDERVVDVQRQVAIPLEVAGQLICHYRADFQVTYADGRIELHEVKGFDTQVWRIKERLMRALYPHRTLRVIRRV